jgi:phage tail-like protein
MTELTLEQLEQAPPSASARAYLSRGLPAVYRDARRRGPSPDGGWRAGGADAAGNRDGDGDALAVRWMRGLEQVLDPTVTLIDNLAWQLHPDLAPDDIVRVLLCWLGLGAAAELPIDGARRVLIRAEFVGRRRGTLRGLHEVLELGFPDLRFDLRQSATFTEGDDPLQVRIAPAPLLVVHGTRRPPVAAQQDEPPQPDRSAFTPAEDRVIRELIEVRLPVHVPYVLHGPETDGVDG